MNGLIYSCANAFSQHPGKCATWCGNARTCPANPKALPESSGVPASSNSCAECGSHSTPDSMLALYCIACIESKLAPALAEGMRPKESGHEESTQASAPQVVEPCGGREYCSRFPFCGCGGPDSLPERDPAVPATEQGLFRKFEVRRTDGSDRPGGKHDGCEYFVLDVTHDVHAKAALTAYAAACRSTHPALANDLWSRHDLGDAAGPQASAPSVQVPDRWQPLTPELLTQIEAGDFTGHLWVFAPRVIARPITAKYEWRQGSYPHGFNTDGAGRVNANQVTHVMPFNSPAPPGTQASAPQVVEPQAWTTQAHIHALTHGKAGYFSKTPDTVWCVPVFFGPARKERSQ